MSALASAGPDELLRVGLEPLQAAVVAEVVRVTAVLDLADRIGRRDRHPADGIDDVLLDLLGHVYFAYFCGSASNLFLQAFAQK